MLVHNIRAPNSSSLSSKFTCRQHQSIVIEGRRCCCQLLLLLRLPNSVLAYCCSRRSRTASCLEVGGGSKCMAAVLSPCPRRLTPGSAALELAPSPGLLSARWRLGAATLPAFRFLLVGWKFGGYAFVHKTEEVKAESGTKTLCYPYPPTRWPTCSKRGLLKGWRPPHSPCPSALRWAGRRHAPAYWPCEWPPEILHLAGRCAPVDNRHVVMSRKKRKHCMHTRTLIPYIHAPLIE